MPAAPPQKKSSTVADRPQSRTPVGGAPHQGQSDAVSRYQMSTPTGCSPWSTSPVRVLAIPGERRVEVRRSFHAIEERPTRDFLDHPEGRQRAGDDGIRDRDRKPIGGLPYRGPGCCGSSRTWPSRQGRSTRQASDSGIRLPSSGDLHGSIALVGRPWGPGGLGGHLGGRCLHNPRVEVQVQFVKCVACTLQSDCPAEYRDASSTRSAGVIPSAASAAESAATLSPSTSIVAVSLLVDRIRTTWPFASGTQTPRTGS